MNVGSRNRLRSNIGCDVRISVMTNATSRAAATAKQVRTSWSVNERWFDSISP